MTIPGGDNFSKAINNLWKQNLFSDIAIYFTRLVGNSIYLEISVTERPRLSNFYFRGVRKGDADDLTTKSGLDQRTRGDRKYETFRDHRHQEILFRRKGYQDAQVTVTETRDPAVANSEIVNFNIVKGPKVRISQINIFRQRGHLRNQSIKHQLKDTQEQSRITLYPPPIDTTYGRHDPMTFQQYVSSWGFLSFTGTKEFLDPYFRFKLFSSAKFNPTKYETDKQHILEYYNSQGYRDAALIADTQIVRDGKMTVDIKVDEGHKYYFGNISWKGNTKYSDSILSLIMGIHRGDVYNLDILNKKLGKQMSPEGGDISGLYMDDGYLFFRVDPVETSVYNDTIDFEIRMTEGPQATIKNVTITGNEKTKEYVIRRELFTIPGDKFSRSDLIRSQRQIANLGFFNQEKINPGVNPNQEDGTVDINWGVEEKSADQLELSAGWGGGIGLTGTVGVTFNNFSIRNIFSKSSWQPLPSGDGQKLSLRIQSNGKAYQSYNFSFTEPWLGGKKRNSLTVSLYRSIFRTGRL